MSLPQPVPRTRKPSKEPPPAKPVPKVRASSSQSLLSSDTDEQQAKVDDKTEGEELMQEQVGVVSSKGNEPTVTVGDDPVSDDDPDYQNMPVAQDDENSDDDVDIKTGKRLSNYLNVAPLPEPVKQSDTNKQQQSNKESLTTNTSTSEDDKKESTDTSDSDVYKFKPKNRAPAIPPPGYKKLPPVTTITSGIETNKDESTSSEGKANFARNRPVVKKPSVLPPTLPSKPQPKVPAKPPRSRDKSSGNTPPLPLATPPILSHPVIISTGKESLEESKDSETTPPSKASNDELSASKPLKEIHIRQLSPVFPPRKAPSPGLPPPPYDDKTSKVELMVGKKSPTTLVETGKGSPSGTRKVARAAPPPPKLGRGTSTGTIKDEPLPETTPTNDEPPAQTTPTTDKRLKQATPTTDRSLKMGTPTTDKPPRPATPISDKPPKPVTPTTDKRLKQASPTTNKSLKQATPTTDKPSKQVIPNTNKLSQATPIINKPSSQATPTTDEQLAKPRDGETTEIKTEMETRSDNHELHLHELQQEDSEIVLTRMNLFTVEMRRVEGQGFGLHIAEGYTQTSKGLEVQGVFVKDIVAGSPADHCGRIRESDMIIDIAGSSMVGASLDDAARLLKNSGNIVRLKIGRTFSNTKGEGCVDPPVNPIQEENDGLKAKIKTLEKELKDSERNVTDLTQAVANVTVEKTKLDMKIRSLNDEVEQLKTASSETSNNKDIEDNGKLLELQQKVDQLNEEKNSLESELKTARDESASLRKDLELSTDAGTIKDKEIDKLKQELEAITKELQNHKDKHEESMTEIISLRKEVEMLKSDVSRVKSEKETIEKSLSMKIIQLEKEVKDTQSTDSSTKHEKSPKVESPNVEIKVETEQKTIKDKTESKKIEEKEETKEATPVNEEAIKKEEEQIKRDEERSSSERSPSRERPLSDVSSIPEEEEFSFDEIKDVNRLSNTKAVEKSKLTSKLKRNRPSKAHIRSLANLSPFPEEMTALSVPENDDLSNRRSVSEGQIPMVAPKPKPKPEDKAAVAPKPRPRPQPRKKQSPERSSEDSADNTKTPPGSPSPSKRPIPVPRTPSREPSSDNSKDDGGDSDKSTSKRNSDIVHKQPVPIPPEKPSKDSSERKSFVKSEDEESTANKRDTPDLPTPKPKPKPSNNPPSSGGGIDSKIEALKRKDPSELTVKEKMILAQQAMAKQAELKSKGLPPPVRKRPPQPIRSDSLDQDGGGAVSTPPTKEVVTDSMERSQSMDDILDGEEEEGGTPKRKPKKLPPGAFKLGIPMGLPGDMRTRSNTVGGSTSTNEPQEEEEVVPTDEPSGTPEDVTTDNNDDSTLQTSTHSTPQRERKELVPEETVDAPDTVSSPDRSCQDTVSSHSNDDGISDNEQQFDNTSENLLETEATLTGTPKADADQVLYWTSEVVSIWLTSIGLGHHAPSIMEKGIKGYMLFDFDTAKLKNIGISSGDDRKLFQKEIKSLKPFAEKLRKEHERQKKEEKKRLEQEKKLAKKKKK